MYGWPLPGHSSSQDAPFLGDVHKALPSNIAFSPLGTDLAGPRSLTEGQKSYPAQADTLSECVLTLMSAAQGRSQHS